MPTARLSDEHVSKLRPGMTTEQVEELLGSPWKLVLHAVDKSRLTYRYVMQSKRMEPVFMILGQSAATAACRSARASVLRRFSNRSRDRM